MTIGPLGASPFIEAARFKQSEQGSPVSSAKPNQNLVNAPQQTDVVAPSDVSIEYNSYAGSDIICTIFIPQPDRSVIADMGQQGGIIGSGYVRIQVELQTLTVSSARSVHPVRRFGEVTPAAYTRGARTIAGTLIFTTLFRDAFAEAYQTSTSDGETDLENFFVDQIPRFNMLIHASNEYGHQASSVLTDVHLTNFGTTLSIDDMYTESTYTYVARNWYPFVEDSVATKIALSSDNPGNTVSDMAKNAILNRNVDGTIVDPSNRGTVNGGNGLGLLSEDEILDSVLTKLYQVPDALGTFFTDIENKVQQANNVNNALNLIIPGFRNGNSL